MRYMRDGGHSINRTTLDFPVLLDKLPSTRFSLKLKFTISNVVTTK